MKGRKPSAYKLNVNDRRYLSQIVTDGQVIQRVANRARVLLAFGSRRTNRRYPALGWDEPDGNLVFMATLLGAWR